MRSLLILAVLLVVVFFGAVMVASETGGEVVTLTTFDEFGGEHETSLWIVEYDGRQWLRAGSDESGWYQRLYVNPRVRLRRAGTETAYRAVPVAPKTEIINDLMARDYGVADQLVGLIRDESRSIAIRLDPAPADDGML